MPAVDGTSQFKQLWLIHFMSLRLPGNEQANPVLADFLFGQNFENDDMTTDYADSNLFMNDHPAVI